MVALGGVRGDDEPQASDPGDQPTHSGKPIEDSLADRRAVGHAVGRGTPSTVAVPLYFVGDTPQGPRLFREFQQVEADNPVDEALAILTAGAADDPDYSTLLDGTSLRGRDDTTRT